MAAGVLLVLLAAAAFAAASPPALPTLPQVFSTRVEANIVDKNYSLHFHEWCGPAPRFWES
jgi:hypothetical protein